MARVHRVAVVLQTYGENTRAILRGVANYVSCGCAWELHASPIGDSSKAIIRAATHADGIITRFYTEELARMVHRAGIPAVGVSYLGKLPIPSVDTKPEAIAAMAVGHFLEQGFSNFAFFGAPGKHFCIERERAFRNELKKRGFRCTVSYAGQTEAEKFAWYEYDASIIAWLRSLPRPIAILAANDVMGQQVLMSATSAGLRVPDDIAVLGVDNDELVCRLTTPPMSSIDAGQERIGFEAAALLDRLLAGKKLRRRKVQVDPSRLIVRQSTDVLAVSDVNVSQAVRFIRQNTARGLCVEDVMREVPIARRRLERAFRRSLGRSIYEEIIQSRIRRAKQLLVETDMRIPDVTESAGFANRTHLNAVFRKTTGHSPAAYRREFRPPR